MSNRPHRHPDLSTILLFAPLFAFTVNAHSEPIRLQTHNRLEATAQLLQGRKEGKVLLLLHGFLQTREFFTVRQLAEALYDMGHTVLLPNLTLGINHRRQSLACEAIHSHFMEQDQEEVALWVDWLHHHSGQPVRLIGHSQGCLVGLAYLADNSQTPVEQAIFSSLSSI